MASSGWNRPSAANQPRKAPKKPSALRGIAAGLVVVAVAVACIVIFMGKEGDVTVKKTEKKPSQIKTVTPAPAPKPELSPKEEQRDRLRKKNAETYKDENGVLRYKNGGARVYDPSRPTQKVSLMTANEPDLPFHYRSELEIARFIIIPPGEPMFGERAYDDAFVRDFEASLKEPIIVTKDDSEEDAELKRAMIEVKTEIMDRVRAGETVKDILESNRTEMRKLAQYKRDLQLEVFNAATDPTKTPEDIDDMLGAANTLLQEKGLKPIGCKALLKANLRRSQRKLNKKGTL